MSNQLRRSEDRLFRRSARRTRKDLFRRRVDRSVGGLQFTCTRFDNGFRAVRTVGGQLNRSRYAWPRAGCARHSSRRPTSWVAVGTAPRRGLRRAVQRPREPRTSAEPLGSAASTMIGSRPIGSNAVFGVGAPRSGTDANLSASSWHRSGLKSVESPSKTMQQDTDRFASVRVLSARRNFDRCSAPK